MAQGDPAAAGPLNDPKVIQKLRQCIPSQLAGIEFRITVPADGVLKNDAVFHAKTYRWEVAYID